jgi:hypothetical protein
MFDLKEGSVVTYYVMKNGNQVRTGQATITGGEGENITLSPPVLLAEDEEVEIEVTPTTRPAIRPTEPIEDDGKGTRDAADTSPGLDG